jgi:hypothetical protein
MRQDASASGNARQVVQGSGIQFIDFHGPAAEPPVSIAPPFGRRNKDQPVRGRDDLLDELARAAAGYRSPAREDHSPGSRISATRNQYWRGNGMIEVALAALAATGGTALVTAMVTDAWEGLRGKVAKLFGRGALAQLDEARAALASASGAELDRARMEQEIVWRTRLTDLLTRHPEAEKELSGLVSEIQAQTIGAAGHIEQHATASDSAQQAVQGQGVQNVTFGGQSGPR